MDKLLINVKLPLTGERHDFWVPLDLTIQQVTELVARAMEVARPDFYRATQDAALMYVDTGEVQDPSMPLGALGLENGARFVLV